MSYNTELPQALEWGFNGDASDRVTMTEIPPGTYTITMTATIDAGGANYQEMTHSVSITFVDPCLSTVPTSQWISLSSPVLYGISDPAIEDYARMTDTVSYSHGNEDGQSFCGPRTYTLQTPFPWANLDSASGQLQVYSTDLALNGSTETVSVEIHLTNYPSVLETISLNIQFVKSCTEAIITAQ